MSDDGSSPEGALGRPEHGARLVARLSPAAPPDAAYALVLAVRERAWEGSAVVREADGSIEQGAWSPDAPPSWLAQAMHALLRSAWQRRRSGHVWPRRLARWRPAPEESA